MPDPYGDPQDGSALARIVDGSDRDAASDWRVTRQPTPGAANEAAPLDAAALPPGCVGEPGEGCGGDRAAVLPALLLLAAARRRRVRCGRGAPMILALALGCGPAPTDSATTTPTDADADADSDADSDADADSDTDADSDADTDTDTDTTAIWVPSPGASWQWQLTGRIDTTVDVDVYDVDLVDVPDDVFTTLHADGRTVICYFSAGSWENWRPDAASFPEAAIGSPLEGWPGEKWLDVRDPDVRALMEARLDLARDRGCDAVEPDNVDGYQNATGFPLNRADQLDYNRFLADAAHARGLSVGLKNAVGLVADLEPSFDWALNEECFQYRECDRNQPFLDASKAVFHVEYVDRQNQAQAAADQVCGDPAVAGLSTLIKTWDLDAFRLACP
ncbi:MAG: endo alpha-1,4 polygalactosaminidase [Myxococcota bacterium]